MVNYGYCRVSTPSQNIDRQVRNILEACPTAHIVKEVYTGTKFQGRKELDKILQVIQPGDAIWFDSVSRMSRTCVEGVELYLDLFEKGVDLHFLKEPHINTETYRRAIQVQVEMTGGLVDEILKGINSYLLLLAKEQVEIAFKQAEKEVMDLRVRTREGMLTARLNGKQIGRAAGSHYTTKKSIEAKQKILKWSRDFSGTLSDIDVINRLGINRHTYYKYKKELLEDMLNNTAEMLKEVGG